MNLYSFHTNPEQLLHADTAHDQVPHLIWDLYKYNPAELKKRESLLAVDPEYAYKYAKNIVKGPFPAGEATIAKDPEYSYYYAMNVLKGPFPAGEAAIAKDPRYAQLYAKNVLKGPFPKE